MKHFVDARISRKNVEWMHLAFVKLSLPSATAPPLLFTILKYKQKLMELFVALGFMMKIKN